MDIFDEYVMHDYKKVEKEIKKEVKKEVEKDSLQTKFRNLCLKYIRVEKKQIPLLHWIIIN
jgi:hypothetical protein